MSYAVKDKSVHDGSPFECYKFTGPFGTYLYTTNSEEVTLDGDTYKPTNISRNDIETGSILDSIKTVDITLPVTSDLAVLYCFLRSPKELSLVIKRAHRGDDYATDFKVEWRGQGLDSEVRDNWATIKTGSLIQSSLNGSVASISYQRICNHILYDARCKVVKADFTLTATVTKVQSQTITVDNDQAGDNGLKAGEMVVVRTGESRPIYDNISDVIRVGYSFVDIKVGDTVQLIHGCDHLRLGDCKNKFDNVVNYGGFDHIPTVNPFTDLKATNEAKIITKTKSELEWVGYQTTAEQST